MEKINLKEYLSIKRGELQFGRYIRFDDGQLRTSEEWQEFFKDKI